MKPIRIGLVAVWPLALLLALISLGGLLIPSLYAREPTPWQLQAKGQDWFDLIAVVPWLVACGVFARDGRRAYRWRMLLAGTYAYCVYELVIYAFAVHFNTLFLVYCAALGVSMFGLIALLSELARERHAIDARAAKLAGAFLVAVGGLFALLWLVEIVPALLRGEPSPQLAETGLFTNPVHVIDLSFVLPIHILVGIALWHRARLGEVYGPVVLAFGVVMAASIGGMLLAIGAMTGELALPVAIMLFAVAGASAAVLARTLYPPHVSAVTAIHAS